MIMDVPADEHYVYVYRDGRGNPVYFGQGREALRPGSHEAGTHNAGLAKWLEEQKGQHRVEIIGPLDSKAMADAIETALISACLPATALSHAFFNVHKGASRFRFRPYGVPLEFADRTFHPLFSDDLKAIAAETGKLLFVYVGQKDFVGEESRRGYDLATPPSDSEIQSRIEAWWQVANRVGGWVAEPTTSPALLVAVTGGPGRQSIIASAAIDQARLAQAERLEGGLLKVPLVSASLDAAGLRGRPIDKTVGLKFNSFRHSQFRVFSAAGIEK